MAKVLAPGQAVGRILEDADATLAFALQPITEALDGSYALLFRTARRGAEVEEAFCHGVDTRYVDRLKEAAEENFLPPWLSGLAPGSVFDRVVFGSDRQFGRTDFYNHVIRPEGRFHCVIATPYVTHRSRYHLVVGRPRSRAEFCADNRRLLRLMLPQVSGILQLRADLADADDALRRVEGALDSCQAPFAIMAGDGTPRFVNQAARRCLAREDTVRLDRNGKLTLVPAIHADRLRRGLAAIARGEGEQVLVFEPPTAAAPVRLVLTRIDGTDLTGQGHADVLVQWDTPPSTGADTRRVASVARDHGLTRRETALLQSLVDGATLRGAGRDLGVSYNTCRSHLRQIFDKVGIHRQSELLRFCVTGSRPVRPAS